MSNMSYCMFENTSNDLRDCVYAMYEAETIQEMDLSKIEHTSLMALYQLCSMFIKEADRLLDTAE